MPNIINALNAIPAYPANSVGVLFGIIIFSPIPFHYIYHYTIP